MKTSGLRELLQYASAARELEEQSREPTFLTDFENFEFRTTMLVEEASLLKKSLPKEYFPHIARIQKRIMAVINPFPNLSYWAGREVVA